MAAKNGEPDPEMNQTLKKVIERAKANNVPAGRHQARDRKSEEQ